MIAAKIILIIIQLLLMINLLVFSYLKKSITKEINNYSDTNGDEYIILMMMLHTEFRKTIYMGFLMLPRIKKIKKDFILKYRMDIIKMELDKLKLIFSLKNASSVPNEEEAEKIKHLENKLRNIDLREKIIKIKKRKKSWVIY